MSHEAHFCTSCYVTTQNCRYWAPNNTNELQGRPLHCAQVTAWCAVSSNGNTGPCFFDKPEGRAVTVNAERYKVMLGTLLRNDITSSSAMNPTRYPVGIIGAAHRAQIFVEVPRTVFPGWLSTRFGEKTWPDSSPDLAVLCFFFVGCVKSEVKGNTSCQDSWLKTANSGAYSRNP